MGEEMNINLDTTYYYIINDDLKMSKGKIAAQVSHVAMMLAERHHEVGKAVVLKAPEHVLKDNMNKPGVVFIQDAGFTEVPPGSLTCIGFCKESHEIIPNIKELKLV